MYTQRSKYWPAYTWKIQTSYSSNFKGKLSHEIKISDGDFEKIYFGVFDKINASFYHLEQLKENEKIAVQMGKKLAKVKIPGTEGMMGIAGSPYEPIGYEYEAFLVTIKSALDFIAILISKGFGRNEDNIISLANNIQVNSANPSSLEGKIYALLNASLFKTFIDGYKGNKPGQKSKRNYATHDGSLPIGTINIPINNPLAPPLLSKALDPNKTDPHASLLSAQNLVEFCEDQFYKLCDFFIEILGLLANSKLKPGPEGSVYNQKLQKT
jgi:hypothetical protein